MLERILNTVGVLGQWGYLLIFIAAFLESSAFMGLVIPGESIVVLAGFLSSRGILDIGDCLWVIALGAVLGDSVGYTLGKVFGRRYFEKHDRLLLLKKEHIRKTEGYFHKHGGKTIFFGRFIGLLRAMAPFVAGMAKMRYREFLVYNAAGGILWAVTFTLLGYFFGQSWQWVEKWSGKAGVFALFILLVIVFFAYLYRTLSRRQAEIYAWFWDKCRGFASNRHVKGFIENHPRVIAFVRERLSPRSYLGLHLTVGLAISAIFAWIFAGITEDVLSGDPFVLVDQWVLSHVLYFRTPVVTRIMIMVTQLGGWVAISIGSLLLIGYLFVKRRIDYIVTYVAAILGGNVLFLVLKAVIRRPRPISETTLIKVGGWSFPSGHAVMSVIFYGIITYFAFRCIKSWNLRVLVVVAAGFVIFLIGFSRIYLQVHYLSDVLAGYASGLFWLAMCITGLEVYRNRLTDMAK
jgi:membrane protein DedA with SNARE-associated domain/membrane-associated phospholipid phosphatase